MRILFVTNKVRFSGPLLGSVSLGSSSDYSSIVLPNDRLSYPKFINNEQLIGIRIFEKVGISHFFVNSIIGRNIDLIFSCYKKVTK